jgi:YVTN family beta-propeller protein
MSADACGVMASDASVANSSESRATSTARSVIWPDSRLSSTAAERSWAKFATRNAPPIPAVAPCFSGSTYPDDIAFTPNGKTAYVSVPGNVYAAPGLVVPIQTATNTAGRAIAVGKFPGSTAITPDGTTVYVADLSGVTPINIATNTAGQPITGVAGPIAITPDGMTIYAVSRPDTVIPINTGTDTVGNAIHVGSQPDDIAITPSATDPGCAR